MEDHNNIKTIAGSLPRFAGKDTHDSIDFADKFKAIPSMSAPDIYSIVMREERSTPTGDENLTKWEGNNTNLCCMLSLATSEGAAMVVKCHALHSEG